MNQFLQQHALASDRGNAARTLVVHEKGSVRGSYSLTAAQVEFEDAPPRIRQGLGKYPIPVTLLARLAVDTAFQKQGIGSGLLRDALLRTAEGAEIIASRALLVHAKDDEDARRFYMRYDFEPSPTDPRHLLLLMKDLKLAAGIG